MRFACQLVIQNQLLTPTPPRHATLDVVRRAFEAAAVMSSPSDEQSMAGKSTRTERSLGRMRSSGNFAVAFLEGATACARVRLRIGGRSQIGLKLPYTHSDYILINRPPRYFGVGSSFALTSIGTFPWRRVGRPLEKRQRRQADLSLPCQFVCLSKREVSSLPRWNVPRNGAALRLLQRRSHTCRRLATDLQICIVFSHAILCGPRFIAYSQESFHQRRPRW